MKVSTRTLVGAVAFVLLAGIAGYLAGAAGAARYEARETLVLAPRLDPTQPREVITTAYSLSEDGRRILLTAIETIELTSDELVGLHHNTEIDVLTAPGANVLHVRARADDPETALDDAASAAAAGAAAFVDLYPVYTIEAPFEMRPATRVPHRGQRGAVLAGIGAVLALGVAGYSRTLGRGADRPSPASEADDQPEPTDTP